MTGLEREAPIDPAQAALLIIDVQNYCNGEEAWTTGFSPAPAGHDAAVMFLGLRIDD